jgi:hypothetical protein
MNPRKKILRFFELRGALLRKALKRFNFNYSIFNFVKNPK